MNAKTEARLWLAAMCAAPVVGVAVTVLGIWLDGAR